MASSKLMHSSASSNPNCTNSDLNHHHHHNHNHNLNYNYNPIYNHTQPKENAEITLATSLINVDNDICTSLDTEINLIDTAGDISTMYFGGDTSEIGRETVVEIWRDIVATGGGERNKCTVEANDEMMTLEEFLVKATTEEDDDEFVETVSVPVEEEVLEGGGIYGVYPMAETGGGRRKRGRGSVVVTETLDKVAQQKQTRMIKNRESAVRSRQRKQAYQAELEALAAKLEEENEQLRKEKADITNQMYKQLMEKVVPVLEKRKPPRSLRRVHSMEW